MGNSNGLCLFKKINVKIVTVLPDYNLNKRVINEYERTFVYNNETLLSELLNFYVGSYVGDEAIPYLPICNEHILFGGDVQYLIKNHRVEWLVPSNQCTIQDYLLCYPEKLELNIVSGIGSSVPDLINWIAIILTIGPGIEWSFKKMKQIYRYIYKELSKSNNSKIIQSFTGKNGQYIKYDDLKSFVVSRKEWDLDTFMNLLQWDDRDFSINMLLYYGFENIGNNHFIFNEELFRSHEKLKEKFDRDLMMEKISNSKE